MQCSVPGACLVAASRFDFQIGTPTSDGFLEVISPFWTEIDSRELGVIIREFRAWLLTYWGSTVETKLALR